MAEEGKKEEKEKKEGEAPAEENPEVEAKKRKKKLMIMAILGALVIGGGGAGAFVFLSGGKKAKAEGDQEVTAKGAAEKADEHGGGEKKEEAKKDDGHGEEKKEEGHGEEKKAEGGHGDEKKAEGGDGHGGEGEKKAEGGAAEKKDTKVQLDIDFGDTLKMSTFNINLGNALENRYVRIEISLEYKGGDATKQEIDKRMPQLRDAIIGILQRKTREFLLAPDGKEALRKEILTRINRYMKSKIESVYITDMLIE